MCCGTVKDACVSHEETCRMHYTQRWCDTAPPPTVPFLSPHAPYGLSQYVGLVDRRSSCHASRQGHQSSNPGNANFVCPPPTQKKTLGIPPGVVSRYLSLLCFTWSLQVWKKGSSHSQNPVHQGKNMVFSGVLEWTASLLTGSGLITQDKWPWSILATEVHG